MSNVLIDTPRVCIPYPTGYTLHDRTYGIKVLGYDKVMYSFWKGLNNRDFDQTEKYKDFYDIVSAAYQIEFNSVPKVRPFVAWVDWCKKNGGVLMHGGEAQQKKLLKEACTLICDSVADNYFLQHIYMNLARKSSGCFLFDYKRTVPARFAEIQDSRVVMLINELAFPNRQR